MKRLFAILFAFIIAWNFLFVKTYAFDAEGFRYENPVEAAASGYEAGWDDGWQDGYIDGYDEAHSLGFHEGEEQGYEKGYEEGYEEGIRKTEYDYEIQKQREAEESREKSKWNTLLIIAAFLAFGGWINKKDNEIQHQKNLASSREDLCTTYYQIIKIASNRSPEVKAVLEKAAFEQKTNLYLDI